MERWEYLTEILKNNKVALGLGSRLNELGSLGWELVSLNPIVLGKEGTFLVPAQSSTSDFIGVFKRRTN